MGPAPARKKVGMKGAPTSKPARLDPIGAADYLQRASGLASPSALIEKRRS